MKPGDKVVCVDTYPNWRSRLLPPISKGCVYVVESVGEVKLGSIVNLIGVSAYPHRGFNPERFRLLTEMKSETKNKNHALI